MVPTMGVVTKAKVKREGRIKMRENGEDEK